MHSYHIYSAPGQHPAQHDQASSEIEVFGWKGKAKQSRNYESDLLGPCEEAQSRLRGLEGNICEIQRKAPNIISLTLFQASSLSLFNLFHLNLKKMEREGKLREWPGFRFPGFWVQRSILSELLGEVNWPPPCDSPTLKQIE